MLCLRIPIPSLPSLPESQSPPPTPSSLKLQRCLFDCHHDPRRRKLQRQSKTHVLKPLLNPTHNRLPTIPPSKKRSNGNISSEGYLGSEMWVLSGFGYWVQGFRCLPWLALNFHMAQGLGLSPAALQLVQNSANLPMVAKPLFGVISDAIYIGNAHRIPYISIGVLLQGISWGTLALIPITGETFPTQMSCILLGNVGASITEVVSDALVAEFSLTQKAGVLQSYAFIALAAGGILGNLSGGFILQRTQDPKAIFFAFALLLFIQMALSLTTKETLLCPPRQLNHHLVQSSLVDTLRQQFSNLMRAISEEKICYPLSWVVASIAAVPILSGSMFCFQTQCLKLDPSIIGLSKVIGQFMVLSATVFYNRRLNRIPMRTLIFGLQILYALAILSDLFLVTQFNIRLGISNEMCVLCLSALAEAVAQFKILPFSVLFSRLCPSGCEGSLFAFFASAVCLSSILSGLLGVGLASLIGVSSGDYSSLPFGIAIQFLAALVPLIWISYVPARSSLGMMKVKRRSKAV